MAREPLRSYQNQLMNYGIGRAFADNKPVTRGQMAQAAIPEDPRTLLDNLRRLKMAGGLSRASEIVPNQAFSLPEDIFEATAAVTGGTSDDFVFTPPPGYEENLTTGVKRKPGEKFSTLDIETTGGQGKLGAKVIPTDLAGGRGTVIEGMGDRAKAMSQMAADAAIDKKMGADAAASVETLFTAGIDEFLKAARGAGPDAPEPKTLDEYKKIFSDATGVDVSGKVDNSQALMALGLALMQNRAGKGFNVGRLLSEAGRAGEAALPALEKAKTEAKQAALAGGKFALEMQSADEAKRAAASEKAMERGNYYIVPKGEGVSGAIANIDKGRLETLSKYEINQLLNNPEFASKYDILPGSTWASVVEEAMKTPEAKDKWLTKGRDIPLIPGVDDDLFKIRVFDPDPNTNPGANTIASGDGQQQYEALARMARDNEKAKQKFVELGILNEGTNIFRYGVDSLNSLASAFNIRFGDDEPDTMKMKRILQAMAAKEAPRILGESGKTISDGDRQRVAEIVSEITPTSDPRVVQAKLESLFNDIILGAENDISQALSTLNRYTGRNIGSVMSDSELSEEEAKELQDALSGMGIS